MIEEFVYQIQGYEMKYSDISIPKNTDSDNQFRSYNTSWCSGGRIIATTGDERDPSMELMRNGTWCKTEDVGPQFVGHSPEGASQIK
ncbi:MAG: hypothetical protein ACRCXZ_05845 [Patescibacteria group bacterium]